MRDWSFDRAESKGWDSTTPSLLRFSIRVRSREECHPERSRRFAKRSSYVVEEPALSGHGPSAHQKSMKLAASYPIENNGCATGVSTERSRRDPYTSDTPS